MQTKLFVEYDQSVVAVGDMVSRTITNPENRKGNFHNIWAQCIINGDAADAATTRSRGFVGVFCVPTENFLVPDLLTSNDLEQSQGIIIACEKWAVLNGAANFALNSPMFKSEHRFNLSKISRTCPKEGRLVFFVSSDGSSAKVADINGVMTCNLTAA